MHYILFSLILLGGLSALLSCWGNRKKRHMPEETHAARPETVRERPAGCCGRHEVCERDSVLAAAGRRIAYYDDEELDRFRGTDAATYPEAAVDEFREVLYTLREAEVAGWLRSLQLRDVSLPDALRDEAFLIVGEQKQTAG